jgi:hypothetical protein
MIMFLEPSETAYIPWIPWSKESEVTAFAADDYRSIQIFELNHVNNLYKWLLEGRNETRSWASVQKGCC